MDLSLHDSQNVGRSSHEMEEMNFFEQELNRMQKLIQVPLMTRRLDCHKEDPMEELMEVYNDCKEIEQTLGKALNIGSK